MLVYLIQLFVLGGVLTGRILELLLALSQLLIVR